MLRYRCPHCSQLLQAHDLRAGKKSVCNACLKSHVIPAPAPPEPDPTPTPIPEPVAAEMKPPEPEPRAVALAVPVPARTQADFVAALTDALIQRMRPRRDLRLSTTAWLLFTGLAVTFLAVSLVTTARAWVGAGRSAAFASSPNPGTLTKLEQLRTYREQKSYDKLIDLLRVLTMKDEVVSIDAKSRAELAAEMKALCTHHDIDVKVAAMAAYTRWGGDDARAICLDALGKSEEERLAALDLLPQWKNTDSAPAVARAIAVLITRPGYLTIRAAMALEQIGGTAAETAAIDLLFRARERFPQLVALDILERVGGDTAIKALEGHANATHDQAIQNRMLETIDAIRNRPKK